MSDFPPDDLRAALDRLRDASHAHDPDAERAAREDVIRIVLERVQSQTAAMLAGPHASLAERLTALEHKIARLMEQVAHWLAEHGRDE